MVTEASVDVAHKKMRKKKKKVQVWMGKMVYSRLLCGFCLSLWVLSSCNHRKELPLQALGWFGVQCLAQRRDQEEPPLKLKIVVILAVCVWACRAIEWIFVPKAFGQHYILDSFLYMYLVSFSSWYWTLFIRQWKLNGSNVLYSLKWMSRFTVAWFSWAKEAGCVLYFTVCQGRCVYSCAVVR